jgi:hypothetical protein
MDCFKEVSICKESLCGNDCCVSLLCQPKEYINEFQEQTNYYRKNIALLCKENTCLNRAHLFSEILPDSPIYFNDCNKFHQTTVLDIDCTKNIVSYCTTHHDDKEFPDLNTCNYFKETNQIAVYHDFLSDCDTDLANLNNYPLVSRVCYEFIVDYCNANNNCVCFWGEKLNPSSGGDYNVQIVPCIFNSCAIEPTTSILTIITSVIFIISWIIHFYLNHINK